VRSGGAVGGKRESAGGIDTADCGQAAEERQAPHRDQATVKAVKSSAQAEVHDPELSILAEPYLRCLR